MPPEGSPSGRPLMGVGDCRISDDAPAPLAAAGSAPRPVPRPLGERLGRGPLRPLAGFHLQGRAPGKVYRYGGLRYQIRSPREGWIAILDPDGTRVSIYPDLDDDLGDPLWTLKDLIP